MKKRILSTIFLELYATKFLDKNRIENAETYKVTKRLAELSDEMNESLEKSLINYLNYTLGYKMNRDYSDNYKEIKKYLNNIVDNFNESSLDNVVEFIDSYTNSLTEDISNHHQTSLFIDAMKNTMSDNKDRVVIVNKGKSYSIEVISRKDEETIPSIIINDIDLFEETLQDFLNTLETSNSSFKNLFDHFDRGEAETRLYEFVMKNATVSDLTDVTRFFKKYEKFIGDETFKNYIRPVQMDDLLGSSVYIMQKKANAAYETPYYLSFMMLDDKASIELPTIRMGIDSENKTAHILATQSSQRDNDEIKYGEIREITKRMMRRTKHFMRCNPTHIFSIIMALGVFKGMGIDNINVTDFFPLRRNKLILENKMNEEEIDTFQSRLVDNNLNNYLRILEFFEGIEIKEYPDMGEGLKLKIGDNVKSDNPFLEKLYYSGYNVAVKQQEKNSNDGDEKNHLKTK